jgi:hypothetical protein
MNSNPWNLTRVTATGNVLGPGVEFGGIVMQTAGTTTTVAAYDHTDATDATKVLITTTATLTAAGQFVAPTGGVSAITVAPPIPASGVKLKTGLHVVVGGTGSPSFWVLSR